MKGPAPYGWIKGVRYAVSLRIPAKLPAAFLKTCAGFWARAKKGLGPGEIVAFSRYLDRRSPVPGRIAKVNDIAGFGLFAARSLEPGEIIGEYAGVLTRKWAPIVNKRNGFNPYLLKYPFESAYAIDARNMGNELRFINHSAAHANIGRQYLRKSGIIHVLFVATKTIDRHEQLLIDYGENFWRFETPADLS